MRAGLHPMQSDRLKALKRYAVLDTPREQDFDEIVALASRICETPISVINLIDDARQWFKAEVGLGVRETPLETSICSHVILQDDFVEIPDTLNDPRMADNPLCIGDDGLRFYAGARLMSSDNLPIGTLCVLDKSPRRLNELQRDTLKVLSRLVMQQLELRLALKNQETLRAEMDHRIKNSLQSTSSVVRLYRRRIKNTEAQEVLDSVAGQIDAAAALHQELQTASSGGSVHVDEFLNRIVSQLQDAAPDNITLTAAAPDQVLSARQAGAIGMIVSEFASNSIKHAFPDGRVGQISITLEQMGDKQLCLRCADNGIGATVEPKAADSTHDGIGLSLIAAAASTLGATVGGGLNGKAGHLLLTFRAETAP